MDLLKQIQADCYQLLDDCDSNGGIWALSSQPASAQKFVTDALRLIRNTLSLVEQVEDYEQCEAAGEKWERTYRLKCPSCGREVSHDIPDDVVILGNVQCERCLTVGWKPKPLEERKPRRRTQPYRRIAGSEAVDTSQSVEAPDVEGEGEGAEDFEGFWAPADDPKPKAKPRKKKPRKHDPTRAQPNWMPFFGEEEIPKLPPEGGEEGEAEGGEEGEPHA